MDAHSIAPLLDVLSYSIMVLFWPSWKRCLHLFDEFLLVISGICHPQILSLMTFLSTTFYPDG